VISCHPDPAQSQHYILKAPAILAREALKHADDMSSYIASATVRVLTEAPPPGVPIQIPPGPDTSALAACAAALPPLVVSSVPGTSDPVPVAALLLRISHTEYMRCIRKEKIEGRLAGTESGVSSAATARTTVGTPSSIHLPDAATSGVLSKN